MATMKDIALKAGVSIGTVDRVLHNRGRFSDETAKAVRKAVDELGYRPNVMARNLSTSKKCTLAVICPYPEQDSSYWSLSLSGMQQAYENMSIYGLTMDVFHYDRYNPGSFTEAADGLAERDYNGFLIAPLVENPVREFISALDPEVPVLFFDTDLSGTGRKSFLGQDSTLSGRLAAKLMHLLSGESDAEYLVVSPRAENIHLKRRIEGFSDSIPGTVRLLMTEIEAEHRKEKFFSQLDEAVGSGTRGIYVVDASAHYTAEYLAGGKRRLPLIGNDLVEENCEGLKNGLIDFILTQRPFEQGYNGIRLLYRYLMLEEDIPAEMIMPIDIITAENLQR